jgi:NADPH2:quinone reductase
MRALVIENYGGPEALALRTYPDPIPGAGQVMVRVAVAAVNFADILTARGGYAGTPKPPVVAGREFAGIEEDSGRRMMGYTQWGAFAERAAVRRELLWPVPEGWTFEQAAAFPVNYFTAYFAYWKAGLLAGTPGSAPRVLIHAVAGGVGTAAVEIGKILGIEMYGTSSSDEKLRRVQQLGLQHPINYKLTDYEDAIHDLTHGEGVDAVFEMLGGEHTAKSTRCLCDFGRVIVYGSATGEPPKLDTRPLYAKGASIHGLWLTYLSGKPQLMADAWRQLSQWIAEGHLRPEIGHALPWERAAEAYKLLINRQNYGKVVLKIGTT